MEQQKLILDYDGVTLKRKCMRKGRAAVTKRVNWSIAVVGSPAGQWPGVRSARVS